MRKKMMLDISWDGSCCFVSDNLTCAVSLLYSANSHQIGENRKSAEQSTTVDVQHTYEPHY